MIDPERFLESLNQRGVDLFVGVPDSLLKHFCSCIDNEHQSVKHIIAANEGNAVAIATGYHLATKKVSVVYMQNSGLGNSVNPLASLCDPLVYSIPLLLIIGWRGEPGVKDEPQHIKQGQITQGQLELLNIPTIVVDSKSDIDNELNKAFSKIVKTNAPVALLIRKNTFSSTNKINKTRLVKTSLSREMALNTILDEVDADDLIVSTTGKTSRELFELRVARKEPPRDFLTVGSMGHTSSIALGVSLGAPSNRVICIDGDGSLLMHLGALAINGDTAPSNFIHVVLNNGAHESVGGQQTVADKLDLQAMAKASGYNTCFMIKNDSELIECFRKSSESLGPIFVEVIVEIGSRENLGRPTSLPIENKEFFMSCVRDDR